MKLTLAFPKAENDATNIELEVEADAIHFDIPVDWMLFQVNGEAYIQFQRTPARIDKANTKTSTTIWVLDDEAHKTLAKPYKTSAKSSSETIFEKERE